MSAPILADAILFQALAQCSLPCAGRHWHWPPLFGEALVGGVIGGWTLEHPHLKVLNKNEPVRFPNHASNRFYWFLDVSGDKMEHRFWPTLACVHLLDIFGWWMMVVRIFFQLHVRQVVRWRSCLQLTSEDLHALCDWRLRSPRFGFGIWAVATGDDPGISHARLHPPLHQKSQVLREAWWMPVKHSKAINHPYHILMVCICLYYTMPHIHSVLRPWMILRSGNVLVARCCKKASRCIQHKLSKQKAGRIRRA